MVYFQYIYILFFLHILLQIFLFKSYEEYILFSFFPYIIFLVTILFMVFKNENALLQCLYFYNIMFLTFLYFLYYILLYRKY